MKEFGGYLELEHYHGIEYHNTAISLNTARNCLRYLIKKYSIKEILLPKYLCSCLLDVCFEEKVKVNFYSIDEKFKPRIDEIEKKLSVDAYVYIINFYGQLDNEDISNFSNVYNNLIIDNVQSFFLKPINKIDTSDYEQIATWVNASSGRYAFIVLSDDARLKSTNQIVYESLFGNDGFILIYGGNINMLAFMQAAIASVDFSVPNGMTNFNFIETPEFLDDSIGTSEELDGINANRANCCYIMGGYGQSQPIFGEGKIFGTNFNNITNYIGNSWIKAKMEIAGANLMISQGFIALRGGKGKSLILASLQEIITLAKSSDIIVTVGTDGLLASEKAKIVSITGNANSVNLIESNGYYINVLPLTADDIANEQMRVQFIYTKNVPLNRLVIQNIVI